jgi:hypothetical protein
LLIAVYFALFESDAHIKSSVSTVYQDTRDIFESLVRNIGKFLVSAFPFIEVG